MQKTNQDTDAWASYKSAGICDYLNYYFRSLGSHRKNWLVIDGDFPEEYLSECSYRYVINKQYFPIYDKNVRYSPVTHKMVSDGTVIKKPPFISVAKYLFDGLTQRKYTGIIEIDNLDTPYSNGVEISYDDLTYPDVE